MESLANKATRSTPAWVPKAGKPAIVTHSRSPPLQTRSQQLSLDNFTDLPARRYKDQDADKAFGSGNGSLRGSRLGYRASASRTPACAQQTHWGVPQCPHHVEHDTAHTSLKQLTDSSSSRRVLLAMRPNTGQCWPTAGLFGCRAIRGCNNGLHQATSKSTRFVCSDSASGPLEAENDGRRRRRQCCQAHGVRAR